MKKAPINSGEKQSKNQSRTELSNIVFGRCAVEEYLDSGKPVEKIYFQHDYGKGSASKIYSAAKERGIPVSHADKATLSSLSAGGNHQGVVMIASEKEYCSLDTLFEIAESRGEKPFFLIADGIEDPHNLGAVIRSCDGAGVHGVIIPKSRSCGITPTVIKTSAGAVHEMAVCRVSNLAETVEKLKKRNVFIYTCEAGGVPYDSVDYSGGAAIVVGSEGFGVSKLIKEKSDFIVSVPMLGKVNSLNVSCATAVVLYGALKSRNTERN